MIQPRHARLGTAGLFALMLGGFITIFDAFVVNVALPALQSSLGGATEDAALVIACYELAFGTVLIAGGRFGDRYGRRRLFRLGMVAFCVASVACAMAPTIFLLGAARAAQGASAALLFPQVYATLRVSLTGPAAARAFGLLGMTLGLAAIGGQVLGGWIVQIDLWGLGWRGAFYAGLPVCGLALALSSCIPESRSEFPPSVDLPSVILVGAGLASGLASLLRLAQGGVTPFNATLFLSATGLVALFAQRQMRLRATGRSPLLDIALLKEPQMRLGSLVVMLVYSTTSSFALGFALLTQRGLGMTALSAGLWFVPSSIGFIAASLLAPRLDRGSQRKTVQLGAMTLVAALAWLITVASRGPGSTQLLLPMIVLGIGQGLCTTPLLDYVLANVPAEQAGMASGWVATVQQVAAASGVAVVGFAMSRVLPGDPTGSPNDDYLHAFQVGAGINLVAVALAFFLLWPRRTVSSREAARS
jgi:MFS family permease